MNEKKQKSDDNDEDDVAGDGGSEMMMMMIVVMGISLPLLLMRTNMTTSDDVRTLRPCNRSLTAAMG